VNRLYARDPTASRRMGVALEVFEECPLDIAAWLDLLQERGFQEMILLGHSFGAQKVAFYAAETSDERVKGLVFMSPADQGFWLESVGDELEPMLRSVSDMVASGQGQRVFEGSIAPYPMSARTIHSLFVSAKSDIFKFGRPDEPWEAVARLTCPILAMMGTVAEFTRPTPSEALTTLRAKAVSSPRCDTIVVESAPHNYRGYETQVTEAIVGWLGEVIDGSRLA
jgi:pimeloyl-ACP methyl ester carboxylesterase